MTLGQFETTPFWWGEEPASEMQQLRVAVCLCGTPVRPNIGGVRAGTAQREIGAFMQHFAATAAQLPTCASAERVVARIRTSLVSSEQKQQITNELKALEQQIGRWLKRREGKTSQPGRSWRLPDREPATEGRDQMVVALQQRGFTFRKSRWLVGKFWELVADLIRRGEVVETPIGTFQAVGSPKRQVRRRFGKRQVLFTRRRRIKFRPHEI